jgi:hypothetical protein
MKLISVVVTVALALSFRVEAASRIQSVYIGFMGDRNACAEASFTKTSVAVRSAPSSHAATVLVLKPGARIYFCDMSGRRWDGIVIPSRENQDCGVSSPVASTRRYIGHCRSGWIPANTLRAHDG